MNQSSDMHEAGQTSQPNLTESLSHLSFGQPAEPVPSAWNDETLHASESCHDSHGHHDHSNGCYSDLLNQADGRCIRIYPWSPIILGRNHLMHLLTQQDLVKVSRNQCQVEYQIYSPMADGPRRALVPNHQTISSQQAASANMSHMIALTASSRSTNSTMVWRALDNMRLAVRNGGKVMLNHGDTFWMIPDRPDTAMVVILNGAPLPSNTICRLSPSVLFHYVSQHSHPWFRSGPPSTAVSAHVPGVPEMVSHLNHVDVPPYLEVTVTPGGQPTNQAGGLESTLASNTEDNVSDPSSYDWQWPEETISDSILMPHVEAVNVPHVAPSSLIDPGHNPAVYGNAQQIEKQHSRGNDCDDNELPVFSNLQSIYWPN